MLEVVLLAASAALGHKVVRPPAAEREVKCWQGSRLCNCALVPANKLAPLKAKRPDLGNSAQSGAPSQRGHSPQQGIFIWDHGQNIGGLGNL